MDNVQIYEERKENGQWLKSIEFKLLIIDKEFTLSLDNDTQNVQPVKRLKNGWLSIILNILNVIL